MSDYAEIRTVVEARLAVLERRMGRIRSDRQREQGPLDPDFEEQATELENKSGLDALDSAGNAELEQIVAALGRLDTGSFGRCGGCGENISLERLQAVPTATACRNCAT